MVEAAGVEPHGAVHLDALIVRYLHLTTRPNLEEMQIDAAKCKEFGK